MKKLFMILVIGGLCFSAMAQEKTAQPSLKIREAGIGFSNLNNFDLLFRVGTQKSLWRFSLLAGTGNNYTIKKDEIKNNDYQYTFGVKAGHEFRSPINKNFEFRYGLDLFFNFNMQKTTTYYSNVETIVTKISGYSPGLNFVLGFNYVVKEKFVIGAEVQPFVAYQIQKREATSTENDVVAEYTENNINFGVTNKSALLSIAYRF